VNTGGAIATSAAMKINQCNFSGNHAVSSGVYDDTTGGVGENLKNSVAMHGGAILSSRTVRDDMIISSGSDDDLKNLDNNRIHQSFFKNNSAYASGKWLLIAIASSSLHTQHI
jgi:hypothetical protein